VNLRSLEPRELQAAGAVLHDAFRRAALDHGAPAAFRDPAESTALAKLYLDAEPEGCVVAETGGALLGCGFVRRRGDIATIGPLAAAVPGRGAGGAMLDELIARAEGWGIASMRLFQDGWNPSSFALYAGRSFAAVDVVACLERAAGAPPRADASRGLEVAAPRANDLAEVAALDHRLTGLERTTDLAAAVRLVARRRGVVVGYLGSADGGRLGPAVALDVADLFALVARALQEADGVTVCRLSTAAPTAMLAALALGFRVASIGTLMVRGIVPSARPPQLYGLKPEIL
jgi:hypothetical protein